MVPRQTEVEHELDASKQPPKIDLALRHKGKRWSEEQRAVLPDGVRDRNVQHHLFEFKITESVNIHTFKQVDMYEHLYPQLKKIKHDEFQSYIVSSKTTDETNLKAWGYKEADYPGVYVSTNPRCEYIVLLLLNELRDVSHNNYFRLFASLKEVRQSALESLLQTHGNHMPNDLVEEEIMRALLAVYQAYNIEVGGLDMGNQLTVDTLFEMGDNIRQSFIATASPEERMMGLAPEERVMGLAPERVIGMYEPEQVIGMYEPEQVMGMYEPEQVMGMYKPEERVIGLSKEERVIGLSKEEKRLLMEELQRSLEHG